MTRSDFLATYANMWSVEYAISPPTIHAMLASRFLMLPTTPIRHQSHRRFNPGTGGSRRTRHSLRTQ